MEPEPVESREFPGSVTVIDQICRTTSFQNNLTMANSRSVRGANSAGNPHLRLSVLKLWAHLIRRFSFPCTDVSGKDEELTALYQSKGFSYYNDC